MKALKGKSIFLALLFIILLTGTIQAKEVSNYYIKASLVPEKQMIKGIVKSDFYNPSNRKLEQVYYRLPANLLREKNSYLYKPWQHMYYPDGFQAGFTEITGIYNDKKNFTYGYEKGSGTFQKFNTDQLLLRVDLEEPLLPGERREFTIEFKTKVSKRLMEPGFYQGNYIWRFGWFPTEKALISGQWSKGYRFATANYSGEIKVPEDYIVAIGADDKQVRYELDKKVVLFNNRQPKRSLPIQISLNLKKVSADYNGIEVLSYYYQNKEKAKFMLNKALEVLKYYEERFGNYPQQRLIISESFERGSGKAADGLVLITSDIYNYFDLQVPHFLDREAERLLAHEIAHEWWGLGVEPELLKANWLSEAFAQYLAMNYYEDKYGAKSPNKYNPDDNRFSVLFLQYYLGNPNLRERYELRYNDVVQKGMDEEIIKDREDLKYTNVDYTRIYLKGYLVLETLSKQIGKEAMAETLRLFYQQAKQRNDIMAKDFVKFVTKRHGKAVGDYLKEWLYTAKNLDYKITDVNASKKNDGYEVEINLDYSGKMSFPVDLLVETEEESKTRKRITPDEKDVTVTIKGKLKRVSLDPQEKLLDIDRVNNYYPRKFKMESAVPHDAYNLKVEPGLVLMETGTQVPGLFLGFGATFRRRYDYAIKAYKLFAPNIYGATASKRLGANLTGSLSMQGDNNDDIDLKANLNYIQYEPVDLGYKGRNMVPKLNWSLGFGKKKIDFEQSRDFVELGLSHDALSKKGFSNNWNLAYYDTGEMKLENNTMAFFGESHEPILMLTAEGGTTNQELPTDMKYELDLRGFNESEGGDGLLGDHMVHLRTALRKPLVQGLEVNIFNDFKAESLEGILYNETGKVWGENDYLLSTVGAELGLGLTTFAAQDFSFKFGYAHPIYQGGSLRIDEKDEFYFGFDIRFFRTIMNAE